MKTWFVALFVGALFAGSACTKQPPPAVLQDGLAASMSDDQILRVLQLDPAKMHAKKEQGDDGYSVIYTDDQHEIWVTRSSFSGVIVMRMKPANQLKTWELGKP